MGKELEPVLITGSHRSGTTWVSKILNSAPNTNLLREPFNPHHRPGVFGADIDTWYLYLNDELGARYEQPFRSMLDFQYNASAELRSLHSFRDAGRMVRDMTEMWRAARNPGCRPLIKDPLALLSTEWIIDNFSAKVVILMRHPAAFVSSLKRVGWKISFNHLLNQPALMDRLPFDIRDQVSAAASNPPDLIERGAVLWNVLYSFVRDYLEGRDSIIVIRHEDLALSTEKQFKFLFQWLELEFTERVRRTILRFSGSHNPKEARGNRVFAIKRNSAGSVYTWKQRLTDDETCTVHRITEMLSDRYYPAESWKEAVNGRIETGPGEAHP